MKSVLEQSRKVMGWKSRLMSLYFKSEEDTMKNEIPADIFLVPPPPPPTPSVWGKIFTKLLKGSTTNYLVIIHATAVFQL